MEGNSSNPGEDMTKLGMKLANTIYRQGLSFVLIAAMAYYFQRENDSLKVHVNQCNEEKIEALKTLLERNMTALENFSFYLRDHKISYEKK